MNIRRLFAVMIGLALSSSIVARPKEILTAEVVIATLEDSLSEATRLDACKIIGQSGAINPWFRVEINRTDGGDYDLSFETRADLSSASYDETTSKQTISYPNVLVAAKHRLSTEHEKSFTSALNQQGPFEVVNTAVLGLETRIVVRANQKVNCENVSSKDSIELLTAFFSGFPKEVVFWKASK